MRIYLAGKVAKGDDIGKIQDWREEYIHALSCFKNVEFISPEDPTLDESKPMQIFGHDCYQIKESDLVIMNASTKMGVGTAQEMIIAKYYGKHVFTVLPKDTHHRRSNLQMYDVLVKDWIHPFIFAMSDRIFESIQEMSQYYQPSDTLVLQSPPKPITVIDSAIEEYLSSKPSSSDQG